MSIQLLIGIKDGRKNKVLKKKLIQILKLQCFTEKKMKYASKFLD